MFASKCLWAAVLLAAGPAWALEGQLSLSLDGKPLRAGEAAEAVVYFRPASPVRPLPPLRAVEMRMERKQFLPRALPVSAGTTVRFQNFDPILHNAFAPKGPHEFDMGLYGEGEGREHVFAKPGLVRVYCNVHHDMVAHVLVLDTPWFGRPDATGKFTLDVPPGTAGELYVWHERARLWRRKLVADADADADGALAITLDLSRPRVPPHMNKFGKPYGSQSRGY